MRFFNCCNFTSATKLIYLSLRYDGNKRSCEQGKKFIIGRVLKSTATESFLQQ